MSVKLLPMLCVLCPLQAIANHCPPGPHPPPPTPRDYSTATIRQWFSQPESISLLNDPVLGNRIWSGEVGAPPPNNRPYLIVRSMGDPGTAERTQQVANAVSQALGNYTGFYPTGTVSSWQRGYYDYLGANGFQMQGTAVGIMINSYSFTHTQPVAGGGQNADLTVVYSAPYPAPWSTPTSELTLQAYYMVPWVNNSAGQGIGQIGMSMLLKDTSTNQILSYGVNLFDTRPDLVGNGTEFVGDDLVHPFVSSPLKPGTVFVTKSPYSTGYRNVSTFSSYQFVRYHISRANLIRGIECVNEARGAPYFSLNPADYRLTSALIGQEMTLYDAGPPPVHRNISMGSSIKDFSVFEIY